MRGTQNSKTPDRQFVKNKIVVSTDKDRNRQTHHKKANTQNINIYNIIHNINSGSNNNLGKTQQITQDPHIYITANFEKTYDTPLKVPKAKPKDKHEMMLEKELRAYKIEVETKFKSSSVNMSYVYPRISQEKNIVEVDLNNKSLNNPDDTIPATIYEIDDELDRILSKAKEQEKPQRQTFIESQTQLREELSKILQPAKVKSRSQERKKPDIAPKIDAKFYKLVQQLLKAEPLKKSNNNKAEKIALYSTQRLIFDDSIHNISKGNSKQELMQQSYLGKTMPAQKLKLYNAKTRMDLARPLESSGNIKKNTQLDELPSLMASETFAPGATLSQKDNKKLHIRTKTFGGNEAKNLRKIVYLKKLTENQSSESKKIEHKSRSNMRAMQLSDYFRNLSNPKSANLNINNKQIDINRSINKIKATKTRGYNQLTNTLSLSTLMNNTNTSQTALKSYMKKP